LIETDLGSLRRTHYSKELDPSKDGSNVTVMGWILSVRGHGNISFVTIRDKMGDIQIVAKAGDCPDEIREKISKLKEHSSIGVSGTVKTSEKAANGVEIIPTKLLLFSKL
jgi:aspartyl-tRNA synthetase